MDASLLGPDIAVQSAAAALASLGFALVFQTPRRHLLAGSLVGATGWAVYLAFARGLGRPFWGTFAAALTVGIASEVLARLHREGAMIFSVPGMIPLVPGTTVYWASLALLEGRIPDAAGLTADTLRFALGIAGGLACATRLAGIVATMAANGRGHARPRPFSLRIVYPMPQSRNRSTK